MASRLTSNTSPINGVMPNGIDGSFSESREWNPQDGRMSPARRTFCLLALFDLILTFLLWVIYTQLIGDRPIWNAFERQVYFYSFQKSLFDSVMIATCRFTFIMLAYALFRISHWWVIAISTSITCIYLLCKCFLFEFNDNFLGGNNPLSYILLIVCFVMAWLETWMLDFKVLPREKQMRSTGRGSGRERDPLLGNTISSTYRSTDGPTEYYSPFHTPDDSEEETEGSQIRNGRHTRSSHGGSFTSLQSSGEYDNYSKLLDEAKDAVLELFKSEDWKTESGKSFEEGVVSSQYMKKYGRKLFRLQGYINLPPKDLWEDMIANLNDSPKWNPTILESRTLEIVDDNTEVTYNITADAGGGLVSSRDFISVRCWEPMPQLALLGIYTAIATGCQHPSMPVQNKHVRGENGPGGWVFEPVEEDPDKCLFTWIVKGENGPGGWVFEPVEEDPDKCLFTWIVNSNLKGWLPQAAIDQAMSGVLRDYFKLLTNHYEEIIQERMNGV